MKTVRYGNTIDHIHTRDEHRAAWGGNRKAKERGTYCVVVPCPWEELALLYSAQFHRAFASESCCHWDGSTLSMYCGDSAIPSRLMERARSIPLLTAEGECLHSGEMPCELFDERGEEG